MLLRPYPCASNTKFNCGDAHMQHTKHDDSEMNCWMKILKKKQVPRTSLLAILTELAN